MTLWFCCYFVDDWFH